MRYPILIATALLSLAAAPAAAVSPETCVAEIKAVVADSFQHGPFEMTGTLDGPLGVSRAVTQIIPGEAMHTLNEADGTSSELTIVDGRMWRRYDGVWKEYPLESNAVAELTKPAFFDALDAITRPICMGEVEIDGAAYLGFGFGIDIPDITLDVSYYVDPESRRVARVDAAMTIAGTPSHTTALYRYDPTLTVTAPLP